MHAEAKTATPELVLSLEPEPVRAPATIEPPAQRPEALDLDRPMSPIERIVQLRQLGITTEEVREFLQLQLEHEKREAEKAYHRAFAAFKRENLPDILKTIHVHFVNRDGKTTDYDHEELADVVSAITGPMALHGLTLKWVPVQEGRGDAQLITVRTTITHELGHSDSVQLYAGPDSSGGKNSIQAVKSTISYLERIGALALTGLAARGMDNDGRGAAGDPEADARPRGKPTTEAPRATSSTPPAEGADLEFARGYDKGSRDQQRAGVEREIDQRPASEKQRGLVGVRLRDTGLSGEVLAAHLGIGSIELLRRGDVDEALAWIKNGGR